MRKNTGWRLRRRGGGTARRSLTTLYLTDFSAPTFVQKYNPLTVRLEAEKLTTFNVLSGLRSPANAGCSDFLVFSGANSRPELNAC